MFRRGGRRSRYDVRQYSNSNTFNVAASGFVVTDTVLFSPSSYSASAANAHLQKDFTVAIGEWQSDFMVTNSTQGNNNAVLYEYIYLADVKAGDLNVYTGAAFSGANELGGSDPRNVPDRVLFRRFCMLDPVFGVVANASFNWHPRRRVVKCRVKIAQALTWRIEILNNSTNVALTGECIALAAVAVKANP